MASQLSDMQHLAIDHRTSSKGSIAESIIFPSTELLLATACRRNVASTALLKLMDGTIWMLKAVGHAWTDRRINKASTLALANADEGMNRAGLKRKFAIGLAMPSLVVLDAISEYVMPEQWGIHEFVSTLRSNQEECFEDVGGSIEPALASILKRLFASLNPDARLYALSGSVLDTRIYNYLIHRDHGRYRLQFAATFPLLLPEIVNARQQGEEEIALRRAIDSGVPLILELADMWGVAPRVVRHIVGKTPSVVGECWVGNSQGLAQILDALPQEFLPGDDPRQWVQFNRAVALAQETSHELPWKSPAALAWLRENKRCWICPPADGSAPVMQRVGLITSVGRLRKSLEHVLSLEVEERHAVLSLNAGLRVRQVVDDLMMSMLRKGRIPHLAACFDREVEWSMKAQRLESRLLLGEAFWSLFPGEFISSDGLRRVVALTDANGFRVQAQALNVCLWSKPDYRERCRQGKSFMLASLDMASGEPQSTAEISLVSHASEHRWSLRVAQHTGPDNKLVTDQCARALNEVLGYCNNTEVRRHIERGQQLISDIGRKGTAWAQRQAELAQFAPILRAVLGSTVYEAAIQQACAIEDTVI